MTLLSRRQAVRRARIFAALLAGTLVAALALVGGVLPAANAATGTLTGTVTEAGSNAPLGGISVQALCWQVTGSTQGQLCGQTQTASDGSYSLALAAGSYKVLFEGFPDHANQYYGGGTELSSATSVPVAVPSGGSIGGIDAALTPLRAVSGTVTGSGEALGGINVTAYRISGGPQPTWNQVQGVVTASDGSYALHLPDGTYRVGFADAQGPFRTAYYDGAGSVEAGTDVVVAGVALTGIDADLLRNSAITGSVTVDGIDMPDVIVTAYRTNPAAPGGWEGFKNTATGADGRYALYLPDGTYRVEFKTYQARFDAVFYPGVGFIENAADIVLAGADVFDISAAIVSGDEGSGPTISGTVTASGTGDPAGYVGVIAWRYNVLAGDWTTARQGITAADGTYALYVPEGTYRIQFNDGLGRYQPVFYGGATTVAQASDIVQTGAGVPGIDVELIENHAIRGTVTADPSPDAPPGPPPTQVIAWRFNTDSFLWERLNEASTEPDGSYALYVPDGTYRIEFQSFAGDYRRPHFYGGSDNVGEALDVAITGADVSGIDAHLMLASRGVELSWLRSGTVSGTGQDGWGPQVAVGPGGVATAVWYERDGTVTRVHASTHPARGAWSAPVKLSAAGQDASDPQIAIAPDGRAVVVWRRWDGSHYRVQATTSTADGPWSSPATLSGEGVDAWDPQVVAGDRGSAVAVWRRADGSTSQIQASTRSSKGAWSSPRGLSATGGSAWDPQVAVGSDGNLAAVWSRTDGAHQRVQVATNTNGSWSAPVNLSASGADADDPQVAVGTRGRATAIWRGTDGSNERIQAATRSSHGTWSSPVALSAAGRDAHDPQVTVDPFGTTVAVWSRWDGSGDRVQSSTRTAQTSWSTPTSLSEGGADSNVPEVTASPDGRATAVWHQLDEYSDIIHAAIRNRDGSWSSPRQIASGFWLNDRPEVATGPDGTVVAVWEGRQDGSATRVHAVVRFDAGGANHCGNEWGIDLNLLFGVAEQFVAPYCRSLSARSAWRPLTYWTLNTVFDQVPPGYVPAAATPQADLIAKLQSVKILLDEGTKRQRTVRFSPEEALRTDITLADYTSFDEFTEAMVASLPRLSALSVGTHTVRTIWTLTAQHCDGLGDVEAFNCLPPGDSNLGAYSFTVVGR